MLSRAGDRGARYVPAVPGPNALAAALHRWDDERQADALYEHLRRVAHSSAAQAAIAITAAPPQPSKRYGVDKLRIVTTSAGTGIERVRWTATTEDEVRALISDGLFRESHHLDAKRETGTSPGARKETARDLASFAIDGGQLLIGVDEDKSAGTFHLAPQPLDGLVEKLEQIATNLVDPPLTIGVTDIPSDDDPRSGYLLVTIAPSPLAPHMVDGRYPARGERTKRALSDAEVVRLHAHRESLDDQVQRLLDEEVARDPVPSEQRRLGHLNLVAQPIKASRRLAHSLVRSNNVQEIFELVHGPDSAMPLMSEGIAKLSPQPLDAGHRMNRAHGVSLSSYAIAPGRSVAPQRTAAALTTEACSTSSSVKTAESASWSDA